MGEEAVAQPNIVANLVDKQSREFGIELRARAAGELLKRPLDRARRVIRSGMGHCTLNWGILTTQRASP